MKNLLYFTLVLTILLVYCTNNTPAIASFSKTKYEPEKIIYDSTKIAFPWLSNYPIESKLINAIPLPKGYERVSTSTNSFAYWLHQIPLKTNDALVHLYNGELKKNQNAHFAILNIDVGNEDLQQCADAVMRLRSEYLFQSKQFDKLHFNYTSGDKASWNDWRSGKRPIINGNQVKWQQKTVTDNSYTCFKNYLRNIFMYCGSLSLSKELKAQSDIHQIKAGDVFIIGGTPGHAEIVMDVAINKKTGKKIFLLAQSYMPAQEIQLLKNPNNEELSPWYEEDFSDQLYTPEFTFNRNNLMRFEE
jgi:hypothetical protein